MDKNKSLVRRKTCRLCNNKDMEEVFKLKPTPPGDAYLPPEKADEIRETYPLDLFLCRDCGLLQLLDTINPGILYGNYIYLTANSLGLVEHFNRYRDDITQRIKPKKGELIVDIGSNDGTLLKHFKKRGMKVLGVEPAKKVAEKARKEGIETLQNFFNYELARNIKKDHGPASIITANNVFANIDNLEEILKGIHKLLSPKGVFIFETGYMTDLINNNLFDNIYHEHLSYFSVKPLESFFKNQEMELIDIKHLSTKGGSIRGTVQFKGARKKTNPSVKKYIDMETKQGMDKPKTFKKFYQRINDEKKRLTNILQDIKKQKKTISGYGASVGVTTMLYEWELKNFLDFLIDDNPQRRGLVSPGLGIPVLSPNVIRERKPDAICILAWRYSDPIITKNKEYIERGGRFIVPFSDSSITKTY